MSDYENTMAEWGMSMYDSAGFGLHVRIKRLNLIAEKEVQLKEAQASYDHCKAMVESNWNAKSFQAYTDASWNLKVCKEELAAAMTQ